MFDPFLQWLMMTVSQWGYWGIFTLMAMESSLLPLPSEIIMIPAGYLASVGKMDFWFAWFLGTFGSLVGALFNYYMAAYLGRPVVLKLFRWFGVSEIHFEKVETYFTRHGEISTFVGRLLPVVRHLISIPAGLARMNVWKMSIFTLLGAGIWVFILTGIGYVAGKNSDAIHELLQKSGLMLGLFIALIIVRYVYYYRSTQKMVHTIEVGVEQLDDLLFHEYHLLLTAHKAIKTKDTVRLMLPDGTLIREFSVDGVFSFANVSLEDVLQKYSTKLGEGNRSNKNYWESHWSTIGMFDVSNDISILVLKGKKHV